MIRGWAQAIEPQHLMKDPDGKVHPIYMEPKLATFPFKLPMD